MATLDSVMKKMDAMEKALGDMVAKANKPAVNPALMFGGYEPRSNDHSWPIQRLKKLAETYDHDAAARLLAGDYGTKPRGIGWGPALRKMAGLTNPSIGGINCTTDALESEHGFVTVEKAASRGVKGVKGEVRKVALAEGSGMTGGYLVPPEFLAELLRIEAEEAFVEKLAKVVPMASRTLTYPALDVTTNQGTGISPYFGGISARWTPEATTLPETEPKFRQVELTAYDLVLYTLASNQLLQDSAIGLDALLTQLFSEAIPWFKDYAFIAGLGAGSSMPLGVINAPASYVQIRTSTTDFTLADAAAMMGRLHPRSWKSACWIMHPSLLPKLIRMTNGATNAPFLVWLNPMGSGNDGPAARPFPAKFFGMDIYWSEKVPSLGGKGDAILADWGQYLIGKRMDIQIESSMHVAFTTNQMAWRVICRCDGRPWLSSTITDARGWVSSPFVVLSDATS